MTRTILPPPPKTVADLRPETYDPALVDYVRKCAHTPTCTTAFVERRAACQCGLAAACAVLGLADPR